MIATRKVYGRFFTRRLAGMLLHLLLLGSAFVVGEVKGQDTTASSVVTNAGSEIPQTTLSEFSSSLAPTTLPPVLAALAVSESSSSSAPLNETTPEGTGIITTISTSTTTTAATTIISSSSSSSSTPEETTAQASSTTPAPASDNGKSLYAECGKNGTVCYGDKGNCIKTGTCTFLGAIKETDAFINITLLTRVYNPPYDGVNLTVELSRDKKGNDSVFRCSKPRFKTFKIRLSWNNKTSYEPGNETQTAQTLIDKNQLKADCLADQEKSNFTIPPSQTVALKFYIENNNTLVSQGLTHIAVQDSTPMPLPANNSREGKSLDFGSSTTSAPTTTESPAVAKENALYEMCLKNTAKCFGDRLGCTDSHNCSILGVIKETRDNYHVYLVTKTYDPPLDYINLTLTLNAPLDNSSTMTTASPIANNSSMLNMTDLFQVDCGKQEFTDLSLKSVWKSHLNSSAPTSSSSPTDASSTLSPSLTNESQILETTVDKMQLQNRCEMSVKSLKGNVTGNSTEETSAGIIEDDVHLYVKLHLENGILSPIEFSDEQLTGLGDSISMNENGTFQIGENGTAYLIVENKGAIIMEPEEEDNSSHPSSSYSQNSAQNVVFSYLLFFISASLVLYSNSKSIC